MSTDGRSQSQTLEAGGLRVAVVAARWNEDLIERMVTRAVEEAKRHGVTEVAVEHVDGSGELPSGAQALARSGKFDAVVAIGVVLRGGTPHFDTVLQRATDGLLRVALEEDAVAIGDCVIAAYDRGQIEMRAGGPGTHEDKGAGAMHAALDLALLKRKYRPDAT
ncbi:MAG TPA: 6,7-dimethyl-8-ribityllumazine synthase [Candidatus Saccharimonadia bacterium]|nr:6,7-dimethyl-8-ribityllumazine synthase [Candidatus Saccharimonadia bacterium]